MPACRQPGVPLNIDERLKEQCPFLTRGEQGEYVIPADKIGEFVHKYLELSDSSDHLEHLKFYRTEGKRPLSSDIDD